MTLIHERSGGVPRVINTLCDNALIGGFAAQTRPVRRAIVQEVCRDFELGQLEQQSSSVDQTAKIEQVSPVPGINRVKPPDEKFVLPGSFEIPEWVGRRGTEGRFDWGPAEQPRAMRRGGNAAVMDAARPAVGRSGRRFLFF